MLATSIIPSSSSSLPTSLIKPPFHFVTSAVCWKAKPPVPGRIKVNICRANIGGDRINVSQIQVDTAVTEAEKLLKAMKLKDGEKKDSLISHIRWMLSTVDEGRVSISAYDTAWVGLIPNVDGSDTPQFPCSIEWIAQNQLRDGSWGDQHSFSVYDRLLNTLASVIALTTWNVHQDKSEAGIGFLKEFSNEPANANLDSMTCGFEILYPPLLERASSLGINIPCDGPFMRQILTLRDQKFARIPMEYVMEVPTTILYSLEGISEGLNWEKLLNYHSQDGGFLTSPSSTAFAFMQTGDAKCLNYLSDMTTKFNGGAPTVYPVDLFARLWAIDRLQRLGISHHFQEQITESLDYVYRYWDEKNGVFSARNSTVCDLDDTAMAFRLLRQHGYTVNPEVFRHFKSKDNFYCFVGERNASSTVTLNLYRASQLKFPGEDILDQARSFSYNYLQEKIISNTEIVDKWVIYSKDIAREIKFGLNVPFYACLPRIDARFYIEQYGGADDVWIAKTFYRVEEISNNYYLDVSKTEFNECQIQHQLEWTEMVKWGEKFKLHEYGLGRERLLQLYFMAAATIFEVDRSGERCGWAKSWAVIHVLEIYFAQIATSKEQRNAFLTHFMSVASGNCDKLDKMGTGLVWIIKELTYQLSVDTFHILQRDIREQLNSIWQAWLRDVMELDTQSDNCLPHEGAFLAHIINMCAGNELCFHQNIDSNHISHLTSKVCFELRRHQQIKGMDSVKENKNTGSTNFMEIEASMQQLFQSGLKIKSQGNMKTNPNFNQAFLNVAKAFYYDAYFDEEAINFHISKVLFEPLIF